MNISLEKIQKLPFVEQLYHFNSIESTNTFAKSLKDFPEKGIVLVCADKQTAGRGQRQNTFFSEVKGGLFASIVCPIADIGSHFIDNRAISLAIYDAVKSTCPVARLSIKWPNDIYWGNKKLCGILLENIPQSSGYIVVGFGINVNTALQTFPEDIRDIATSLLIETGKKHNEHVLLRRILDWFWRYLALDSAAAHLLYSHRLYKKGWECEVNGQKGVFEGVHDDGRMLLKTGDKEILLSSGPVRF
jgi:BirA family biotin operon repressor/biotin-[acetyl-CoA-carboxylase] ligase